MHHMALGHRQTQLQREGPIRYIEGDSVMASRIENAGLDNIIIVSLSQQWTAAHVKLIKCDG